MRLAASAIVVTTVVAIVEEKICRISECTVLDILPAVLYADILPAVLYADILPAVLSRTFCQ